jgi:hypothetical protein
MNRSHEPIRLEAHLSRQASAVMGRAFQDDPGWQYLIPEHARRLRLLPSFFHIVVRYSMLMQPVLPCYLETSKERNVPFYKKYGFTVMSEGVVSKSDLPVWAMLRKPFRKPTSLPHSAPQN